VGIVEALGKQLTNSGEMVRGYAAIAVGYLTFNPIAKRQTLNMFVVVIRFLICYSIKLFHRCIAAGPGDAMQAAASPIVCPPQKN